MEFIRCCVSPFSGRRLPGTPFQFLDKYFPGNWNTTLSICVVREICTKLNARTKLNNY